RAMLMVPFIGPCLSAFALGRLALALRLTLDSELDIARAARLSLEATGNQAFTVEADRVVKTVKGGDKLAVAFAPLRVLPDEFKNVIIIGEENGNLPEVLERHAQELGEEAGRRLTALTKALGFLLWVMYAGFMIFLIFSIANIYLGMIGRGLDPGNRN